MRCCMFIILSNVLHLLLFFRLILHPSLFSFFFFNDTATTEIYTLSLHDALPISILPLLLIALAPARAANPDELLEPDKAFRFSAQAIDAARSEEHTSELQSLTNLVCRLLLEKKKKYTTHDKIDVVYEMLHVHHTL